MAFRSGRDRMLYEQFKSEVTYVSLKSKETGRAKRVIRWRGRNFASGNLNQVFPKIKEEISRPVSK